MRHPVTFRTDALAVEAFRTTGQNRIDDIVVLDAGGKPVGLIDTQDLARLKIVQSWEMACCGNAGILRFFLPQIDADGHR